MITPSKVAFLQRDSYGRFQLAVAQPDGAGVTAMPTHESISRPMFTADGQTLLISAAVNDSSVGQYGIFAVGANKVVRRLTAPQFADLEVAVTPGGQTVAFARNIHGSLDPSSWAIFLCTGTGADVRGLGATRGGRSPTLSPDGSHLVYVKPDGLHVIFSNGLDDRQITSGWAADPAWAPSGSRIAYVQFTSAGHSHVVIRQPDGALVSVENSVGFAECPVWAPDGQSLVYLAYTGWGWDARQSATVYQVPATGGTPTKLFSYASPIYTLAAAFPPVPAPTPSPLPSPSPSPSPSPTTSPTLSPTPSTTPSP